MKKITVTIGLTLALILSIATTSFAAVTTLWRATDTTYVESEHGDNYFADTYYGTASVRGADRDLDTKGRDIYYTWTKISYDVQGDIDHTTAYSGGKYDEKQVISKITVKDKWNIGSKTKAYYNYATCIVDESVRRLDRNIEALHGGVLELGEKVEHGRIFKINS